MYAEINVRSSFWRARISRLIETGEIVDEVERHKLQQLLTTKRFNGYGLSRSPISHNSDDLPDYAIRKVVELC